MRFVRFVWWDEVWDRSNPDAPIPVTLVTGKSANETFSKTHHAAFDRELFTIDIDYRLRVNPSFETESDLLQRTIIQQAGEGVALSEKSLSQAFLVEHNAGLTWV